MSSRWLSMSVVVLLVACASGVQRHDDPDRRASYFSEGGKVAQEVTLSLSKEAQAKLPDNLKFDQEKLLGTVRRALDAKGLLAKTPDPNLPRIEIVITDVRARSTFSAVMFGFMAGDDRVAGEVIARTADGKEIQRFRVSASYALGGLAGGQEEARMNWLYETFAQRTAEELTGAKQPN